MDGSEERERRQRARRVYETPMGQRDQAHELGASGFRLDGIGYNTGTPASVTAANAVGMRLNLAPPQFALHQPNSSDLAGSAFATPVNAFTTPEQTNSWSYPSEVTPKPPLHGAREMDGYWSPDDMAGVQFGNQHVMDGPPTPFGAGPNVVDQDFILNLNQEGDIQRLTRKAEADVKHAGKQLAMDALRKQVDSLDDDNWMYSN
ncbi:hypothetical protein GGH96_005654 [Coemansia sp. RSA 1972]|nr:hypothetical protein GGH96_005654 [Coemansia sp. RSA 1972]